MPRGPGASNVAITCVSVASVTEHVSVPAHPPPLQPVNVEPSSGTASSVTFVSWKNVAEQVGPQSMPPAPPTYPVPVPFFAIDRIAAGGGGGGGGGASSKPAVMFVLPSPPCSWIVQVVPVPKDEQSPPQPPKVAFVSGVAVKVTVEFCFIRALQVDGQSIEVLFGSGEPAR